MLEHFAGMNRARTRHDLSSQMDSAAQAIAAVPRRLLVSQRLDRVQRRRAPGRQQPEEESDA